LTGFGSAEPGTVNVIHGGPDDDIITGAGGNGGLHGDHGNDCIMGLAGDDYLGGDRGADFIAAGIGLDLAVGGRDYDELYGQDGSDKLYAATVSILVPQFPDSCEQSGEFGSVEGPPEIGDASRGSQKENLLVGGDGYDTLVGSNRIDNMQGNEKGDDLYGFDGPNSLRGDRGADCLSGGLGQDILVDADPNNSQPPDTDTLWGGYHLDQLSALDGDGLDKLDGGIIIRIPPLPPLPRDRCRSDAGDAVTRCTSVP
jgi:Ca2+-binding RTX toxin-like protein